MKKINLSKEQALGIIRHTLTFVGGLLVINGYITDAMSNEIMGGILALTGAIWSVVSKN